MGSKVLEEINAYRHQKVNQLRTKIAELKKEIREAQVMGCKATADLWLQDLAFLEDDLHFTLKAIEETNG